MYIISTICTILGISMDKELQKCFHKNLSNPAHRLLCRYATLKTTHSLLISTMRSATSSMHSCKGLSDVQFSTGAHGTVHLSIASLRTTTHFLFVFSDLEPRD